MQSTPLPSPRPRHLTLVSKAPTGQPRTYRVTTGDVAARDAAYRKLALAILGLDVGTLAAQLRSQRLLP